MATENESNVQIMEKWSPYQGNSDLVVCGASPENDVESEARESFSFLTGGCANAASSLDDCQKTLAEVLFPELHEKCEDAASHEVLTVSAEEIESKCDLFRLSFAVDESCAVNAQEKSTAENGVDSQENNITEDGADSQETSITENEAEPCRNCDDKEEEKCIDECLCLPDLKLLQGFQNVELPGEDVVVCINAGETQSLGIAYQQDTYFLGGEEIRLEEEMLTESESLPVYQTARSGDFSYVIEDIPAGDYLVDLHFAEIFYVNGPKGIRVFDVFIQNVKVLSELDIYDRVGSKTPLIMMNAPAKVADGGTLSIRFQSVSGSPLVSAICIRRSSFKDYVENNCTTVKLHEENNNRESKALEAQENSNQSSHNSSVNYEKEVEKLQKEIAGLRNELMYKSMDVGSLAQAVEGSVFELGYLKQKLMEANKERKQLYNKLLEMKGNIRVFCRCRPLNEEEISKGVTSVVEFDAAKDGEISIRSTGAPRRLFKFDSVFTPQDCQEKVFEDTAPVVLSVLDGYNVCIFAYGQTGTGKTFTMEGNLENRGVNYRTLEDLFREVNERRGQITYDISVSALEVYNEHIRDLLASSQAVQNPKKLEVKQISDGEYHVPGLVVAQVNNTSQVWEVLQTGSSARVVGATNANEYSSRSHCVICVMVKGRNLINGECTRSKLWLVDLAGSERVAKTEVQGERLKEAQNINKSLSALGDVIHALSTKSSHIPFRNSKLTHLLQDSLGGDSKAIMFVQISPSENDASETLCSLNFASRVRGVELGPAKKQYDISDLQKFKQVIEKYKSEIKSKDEAMKKMEETMQNLEAKFKAQQKKMEETIQNQEAKFKAQQKNLQDKIRDLEGQLTGEKRVRSSLEFKLKEKQQTEKAHTGYEIGTLNPITEPGISSRDLVNLTDVFADNKDSHTKNSDPLTENMQRHNMMECNYKIQQGAGDLLSREQKENKVELNEQALKPRRTARLSYCTAGQKKSTFPARRVSMYPSEKPKVMFDAPRDQQNTSHVPSCLPTHDLGISTNPTPVSLRGVRTSNVLNRLRRSIQTKILSQTPPKSPVEDGDTAVVAEGPKLPPLDPNRHRRVSSMRTWGRISGTGNFGAAQRVLIPPSKGGALMNTAKIREKKAWAR